MSSHTYKSGSVTIDAEMYTISILNVIVSYQAVQFGEHLKMTFASYGGGGSRCVRNQFGTGIFGHFVLTSFGIQPAKLSKIYRPKQSSNH